MGCLNVDLPNRQWAVQRLATSIFCHGSLDYKSPERAHDDIYMSIVSHYW